MKKAPQWDLIQNSTQALRCDPLPALQTSHQYEACALKLVFVYHLESVSLVCSRQATVVHLVPTNLREQVAQFCCKIRRQAIYIYIYSAVTEYFCGTCFDHKVAGVAKKHARG